MGSERFAPLTTIADIYRKRFDKKMLQQKNQVWRLICKHYLQRHISLSDAVLDLGAGTCEFINNIHCAKKYAVDLNPDTAEFADEGVEVIRPSADGLLELESESVNVVFASNFFEHLSSRQHIIDTLAEIRRILAAQGSLIIVQPNIKYLYTHYWDYFDHQIALSEESMREILKARFLPYTFRSRCPKGSFFVKTYLKFSIFHHIFGKQMFIVARKL
jgi:SAM-dependent methyltransferase